MLCSFSAHLETRFPRSPLIIRVPFFLLFGFNKGTPKKKGKRVLLGNLEKHFQRSSFNNYGLGISGSQTSIKLHISTGNMMPTSGF